MKLYRRKCESVLKTFKSNSIDSIITDPPYGISFMGKEWDYKVPSVEVWKEILRVAKPGAMLLCFGGTKTSHRMAVNIEDAGWKIRDTIMWVYGSGFPKSHDISKAIDRAAGVERKIIGRKSHAKKDFKDNLYAQDPANRNNSKIFGYGEELLTEPKTPEAKQWKGYGTALKPAWEPIIVAMKPTEGTFANNALKWGVAGLNIDGGRVEYPTGDDAYKKGIERAKAPRADIRGGGFHSGPDWSVKKM